MPSYIRVKIKGISPLLMNRFTEASELAVERGKSSAHTAREKPSRRERADQSAYKLSSGELYIPGPNLYAAVIDAGKFHKIGRGKATTGRSSLIPGGVQMLTMESPLGTKDFEVGYVAPAMHLNNEPRHYANL